MKPIPPVGGYGEGAALADQQPRSSGRVESELEMDKGRTRGSHINEVILGLENGLHLGKCTIDPV